MRSAVQWRVRIRRLRERLSAEQAQCGGVVTSPDRPVSARAVRAEGKSPRSFPDSGAAQALPALLRGRGPWMRGTTRVHAYIGMHQRPPGTEPEPERMHAANHEECSRVPTPTENGMLRGGTQPSQTQH